MAITEQAPISPKVGQRMTVEEFLKLPEEEPALELIDGVVRQKVSPKFGHGVSQFNLARRIDEFARDRGLGVVVTETRFVRPRWAPVPDIGFYRWERLPDDLDEATLDDILVPPDLAIEILSANQSVSELVRKCAGMVENGVRVALLLHRWDKSVFIFRPEVPLRVLTGTDRVDLDDVLPGFEITVAEIFDLLTPRRPTKGEVPSE